MEIPYILVISNIINQSSPKVNYFSTPITQPDYFSTLCVGEMLDSFLDIVAFSFLQSKDVHRNPSVIIQAFPQPLHRQHMSIV